MKRRMRQRCIGYFKVEIERKLRDTYHSYNKQVTTRTIKTIKDKRTAVHYEKENETTKHWIFQRRDRKNITRYLPFIQQSSHNNQDEHIFFVFFHII